MERGSRAGEPAAESGKGINKTARIVLRSPLSSSIQSEGTMEYRFAGRVAGMRSSVIREILKVTERPEVISFAGGLPAPELFPSGEPFFPGGGVKNCRRLNFSNTTPERIAEGIRRLAEIFAEAIRGTSHR
jgi:DNA-binding transcriptional MocR family regulator